MVMNHNLGVPGYKPECWFLWREQLGFEVLDVKAEKTSTMWISFDVAPGRVGFWSHCFVCLQDFQKTVDESEWEATLDEMLHGHICPGKPSKKEWVQGELF